MLQYISRTQVDIEAQSLITVLRKVVVPNWLHIPIRVYGIHHVGFTCNFRLVLHEVRQRCNTT
jgi:hypothetical protein